MIDRLPSPHLFRDRVDAGAHLAERLDPYRGRKALVLGIPRGGVPVAAEVARHLEAELDIVVARKLGAPDQPELALGAVTANGGRFLNEELCQQLEISDAYLTAVTAEQQAEARQREGRLRGSRAAPRVKDRIVIIVDDGLATGATMRAAVRSVRKRQPARLVVAIPVGSRDACAALRAEADEVVCLHEPEPFWAVGLHYERFEPTEDAEVLRIVREARARRRGPTTPARPGTPARS
ncbi:MAG: phosphoribosyltransferase [Chloroflexi bacterium]|nr:phosphoribosyltransferase [Chloroflexota bacterium]